MPQIQTEIEIKASASLVWAILTDFGAYRRWNPFIRSVVGQPRKGAAIEVTLQPRGEEAMTLRPTLVRVREQRELHWAERSTVPGLFAAEHRFTIEPLPKGGVRFHQTHEYRGFLASLMRRSPRPEILASNAMNAALKSRAERAESRLPSHQPLS